MVESNALLYKKGEKPDHCVVIKYVPYVGDSKRAMDEYTSEIMMGGRNTIVVHNTCEDSLLASPLILDLVILAELCERIKFKVGNEVEFHSFNSVLSILSYMLKAPLVPAGTPIVNALFRQRACIENVLRACIGLAPINHMLLEYKAEKIVENLRQRYVREDTKKNQKVEETVDIPDIKIESSKFAHLNGICLNKHVPNGASCKGMNGVVNGLNNGCCAVNGH